jgi:O-antigen/teichoic acid export membrane protein
LAGAKPLSPFTAERLLAHNVFVAGGTLSAGILGFVFQAFLTHRLEPADYGSVFAVLALVTLVGLPAGSVTLVIARETSRSRASGDSIASSALLATGNRWLLATGAALAAVITVSSPWLSPLLAVPAGLLVVAAGALPFSLSLPLFLGALQGAQRFAALSFVTGGQAAAKLTGAVLLGLLWGPIGFLAGISMASAIVYLAALLIVRPGWRATSIGLEWDRLLKYGLLILCSTSAVAVLFSSDVLLVKHFFGMKAAGDYSAVAAIGRTIFWAAGGVAGVLFPKVIFRETSGESGIRIVLASILLALIGGVLSLAVFSVWSRSLLVVFAGPAYAKAAAYLPLYGLAMMFLAVASVLITTYQSRNRWHFLWLLLPVTALEPLLIILFHSDLKQVVDMVDLSMLALLAGLSLLYVLGASTNRHGAYTRFVMTAQPCGVVSSNGTR